MLGVLIELDAEFSLDSNWGPNAKSDECLGILEEFLEIKSSSEVTGTGLASDSTSR